MSLSSSDITFNYPKTISDAATNGGQMSKNTIKSGAIGALFPRPTVEERDTGLTRYRKIFFKLNNNGPDTLSSLKLYLSKYTPAGDSIVFFPTTNEYTQDDIVGTERKYGVASLVSIVDDTMVVDVEDSSFTGIIQNGDTIQVSNRLVPGGSGNVDRVTVSSSPSVSGNRLTFTFTGDIINTYEAGDFVSSIYDHGDLVGTISSASVTSSSGTFNEEDIVLTNASTIKETVTLTFINSTQFSAVGSVSGPLGTGNIGATFSPNNPDFTLPLFSIPITAWGGTFANGDVVSFITNPPVVPMFIIEKIPSECGTLVGNNTYLCWEGQVSA